jgi:hypothetical protein
MARNFGLLVPDPKRLLGARIDRLVHRVRQRSRRGGHQDPDSFTVFAVN